MSVNLQAGQDSCNPDIWNQVLALVAKRIQPGCFDTWFRPVVFAGRDATGLRVTVPNESFRKYFLANYADVLHDAVVRIAGVRGRKDKNPGLIRSTAPELTRGVTHVDALANELEIGKGKLGLGGSCHRRECRPSIRQN